MTDFLDDLSAQLRAKGILPPAEAPAMQFGDAYVRAGDRDLRARGMEYNAQLALGESLDELDGVTRDKSVSVPGGDDGANIQRAP